MVGCWSGTSPIAGTVMAAAVAIVEGNVAADAITGTGTMKAVQSRRWARREDAVVKERPCAR
jgi:hypothetical protein